MRKVTRSLISDVMQALAGCCLVPSTVQPPAWLDGPGPFPADEVLPARNALIHVPGFAEGKPGSIIPPTPRFFNFWALDYDFDPDALDPYAWLAFLDELWPDDLVSIAVLQMWFGYCLTSDTSQHKILGILGPRRSGKGTIARILSAMVGGDNTVAGPTLSSFATDFGLATLIGKSLAIIDDARLSGRSDVAIVTERLLTISGEGTLSIARKYKEDWTGKLRTRLVLISNELPRIADPSSALVGRMILLQTTQSFYGREDHGLFDRLKAELPGILLWAIEGWKELRKTGHFVQPKSGEDLIEEMDRLGNPVGAFLKDRCIIGPGHEVMVKELFHAWQVWCTANGHRHPRTAQEFGKDLRAILPNLKIARPLDTGHQRIYQGVNLKDPNAIDGNF
jgi:putative DNA primase/helicase